MSASPARSNERLHIRGTSNAALISRFGGGKVQKCRVFGAEDAQKCHGEIRLDMPHRQDQFSLEVAQGDPGWQAFEPRAPMLGWSEQVRRGGAPRDALALPSAVEDPRQRLAAS